MNINILSLSFYNKLAQNYPKTSFSMLGNSNAALCISSTFKNGIGTFTTPELKIKLATPEISSPYDMTINIVDTNIDIVGVVYKVYEKASVEAENPTSPIKTIERASQGGITTVSVSGSKVYAVSAYVPNNETYIESSLSDWLGVRSCFTAGTPVVMADGSYKTIETIAAGDYIYAYDTQTTNYCTAIVTENVLGYTNRIAMILLDNGTYITMAESHPLFTANGLHSITNKDGLDTLVIGDALFTVNGYSTIVDLQVVDSAEPVSVYSLAIAKVKDDQIVASDSLVYFAGTVAAPVHSY